MYAAICQIRRPGSSRVALPALNLYHVPEIYRTAAPAPAAAPALVIIGPLSEHRTTAQYRRWNCYKKRCRPKGVSGRRALADRGRGRAAQGSNRLTPPAP
ncbi:hypothetical protein EVAR_24156_1 [Eumeta japonica]|uniref:Uncharacterized protein n=1 Tax=Eumeta variegata TaxID=151549 RepID=A0A4C1W4N8_EUMVA|nr:hypothetical protein EVAR_24156_1 [Eumeta japonica]